MWAFVRDAWRMAKVGRHARGGLVVTYALDDELPSGAWIGVLRTCYVHQDHVRAPRRDPTPKRAAA